MEFTKKTEKSLQISERAAECNKSIDIIHNQYSKDSQVSLCTAITRLSMVSKFAQVPKAATPIAVEIEASNQGMSEGNLTKELRKKSKSDSS